MQKITPHLWFDKEAKEAAELYASIFPESKIENITTLHNTPSGDCDVVSFNLSGYSFIAINAGPLFKPNPSISFIINFDPSRDKEARANIDVFWEKLSQEGKVMMPLQQYPFSERYGWVQDRYGISWQLILSNPAGEERPFITPSFMFVGNVYGKAEEAINFYQSVFKNSRPGMIARYGKNSEIDKENAIMYSDFVLENQWFAAMESGWNHGFSFNEAISLIVNCDSQEEIDYYWNQLSAVPESEQCGWLKDKYGVSWQIVPKDLSQMLSQGTPAQIDKLTQAFLKMKKFNVNKLREVFSEKD